MIAGILNREKYKTPEFLQSFVLNDHKKQQLSLDLGQRDGILIRQKVFFLQFRTTICQP